MESLGMSDNSKTVLFPFEASNTLGSAGAIASFAKDLLDNTSKGTK